MVGRELALALGLKDWELDTGGESDIYVVRSFDGVVALSGLTKVVLDAYGVPESGSIAGLRGHRTLEEVSVCGSLDDADVLLTCPQLKRVRVMSHVRLDPAVRGALEARGVDIVTR